MQVLLSLVLFVGLLVEAWFLAPPVRPDLWQWVWDLTVGNWSNDDPTVIAFFNLMGVWPVLFGVRLRRELFAGPVPAAPVVLASVFFGGYALLPFLALRAWVGPAEPGPRGLALAKVLSSPLGSASIFAVGTGMAAWGLIRGDLSVLAEVVRTEGFAHVMALDFLALWISYGMLATEREDGRWWLAIVPVVGSSLWGTFDAIAEHAPEEEG